MRLAQQQGSGVQRDACSGAREAHSPASFLSCFFLLTLMCRHLATLHCRSDPTGLCTLELSQPCEYDGVVYEVGARLGCLY